MTTSPSIVTLIWTAAQLPTNLFPEVSEGTGTGCSVCSWYDALNGEINLDFGTEPVPQAYNPIIVADGVRFAPPPGSLADLATTRKVVWKLPAEPYPASVVLDVGYKQEPGGKMVSALRLFNAAKSPEAPLADAAE